MHLGYTIVVVSPAGRKRYMELLFPQILALRPLVDSYRIWVNTDVPEDLAYFETLRRDYPDFVVLQRLPSGIAPSIWSIPHFFRECVDEKTVYVRFDDDIVYMEGIDAFRGFLDFRIQHPEYFVVYPVIMNNAAVSFLQKQHGNIQTTKNLTYECFCPVGLSDPMFAEELHRQVLAAPSLSSFYLPDRVLEKTIRASINCISWFGYRFQKFKGAVGRDEEEWLARAAPNAFKESNALYGKFVCVHFAFRTQRDHLDTTDVLEQYRQKVFKTNS